MSRTFSNNSRNLQVFINVFSEDKVDFVVKQALLNQVAVEIICFSASVVHVQL